MKIVSIGAGPAGLYFSILMKQAYPGCEIEVIERNRHDDTFGWGVVFSDETLGNIEAADPPTMAKIREHFRYWENIDTFYSPSGAAKLDKVTSTGHGFCGMSRQQLLLILQERARDLGVKLEFEREVKSVDEFADADLILAADGLNSVIRDAHAEYFKPSIDWRECKFAWFGTDLELEAFTFVFRENEHGLFRVHAYPFEAGRSTWIVECREETWRKAGLDQMSEEESVAYCEKLFADDLRGHRLLTNRSIWRTFPTVTNETWHHKNIVLIGDSAHTAHFSIGSGTKLAMEDAIALVDAFNEHGTSDVPAVLAAYEDARYIDVLKTQKAAQTSLEWFENTERYTDQHPLQFNFNLLTRSKRITYDNLWRRDPELVEEVSEWYRQHVGASLTSEGTCPAPVFTPLKLRGVSFPNRIAVSPMCQYSAIDGVPNDWHLVHLGSRATGGAGLVMTEMTNVSEDGRITHGCAGMWNSKQRDAWKRIVDFCHANSAGVIGMQLAHAGRKASCALPWEGDTSLDLADASKLSGEQKAWETIAPSALPFNKGWHTPREMTRKDMDRVRDDFASAAERALEAGFDLVEVHMAHGYLLSEFLSPLVNKRDDEYGGSLENRARFPLEVFDAVRAVWPEDKPVLVRISATDWLEDEERGMTISDSIAFAKLLKEHGCDMIDVSTAGNSPESKPVYGRMYQVPFAEQIRREAKIPVMAVGAIQGADHANTILAAGRADMCAMARPHLADFSLTLRAAQKYEHFDQFFPKQYAVAKPRKRVEKR